MASVRRAEPPTPAALRWSAVPPTRPPRKARALLRIWFNRSYATTAHTITRLRADPPGGVPVRVLGTHVDPASPVLVFCDEQEQEPDLPAEEYVEWALDLCRRHRIDVAVPRVQAAALSAARERFAAAGVALVVAPEAAIAVLDDKALAYRAAAEAGLLVPPHRVVASGGALVRAAADLARIDGTVCIKPVTGAGGDGFRVLTTTRPGLADLLAPPAPTVHLDDAAAALDEPGAPPFLVMPVLPGPEVSVDCLADASGRLLAAITRTKGHRRVLLDADPEARAGAATVVERHRLAFLSNTQFRYWRQPGVDDAPRPYLLETNARAAAGIHQTGATGAHLVRDAITVALGGEPAPIAPRPHPGLVSLPTAYADGPRPVVTASPGTR